MGSAESYKGASCMSCGCTADADYSSQFSRRQGPKFIFCEVDSGCNTTLPCRHSAIGGLGGTEFADDDDDIFPMTAVSKQFVPISPAMDSQPSNQALELPIAGARLPSESFIPSAVGESSTCIAGNKSLYGIVTACPTRSTVDSVVSGDNEEFSSAAGDFHMFDCESEKTLPDASGAYHKQVHSDGWLLDISLPLEKMVTKAVDVDTQRPQPNQDTEYEYECGYQDELEHTPQAWFNQLVLGVALVLDQDTVHVKLDTELGCLAILDHDLLFPLSELRTCSPVVQSSDATDRRNVADVNPATFRKLMFDLEVAFAEFDVLVFRFCHEADRASLAAVLEALALQARAGNFPEGNCSMVGVGL